MTTRLLTLPLSLVTLVAGCDTPEGGDSLEGDPMADTGGDSDEVPADDTAGGSADPGDDLPEPDAPDAPEEPGFDNDPEDALGALPGMWYACDAQGVYYDLFFLEGQGLLARDEQGAEVQGTYGVDGSSLTLSFPDLGISETTSDGWVDLDHLVQFSMPGLQCNAVSLDHTASTEVTIVQCPSIKYIPEVGWEDNEFHFGQGGDVYRRRWKELSGVNDTLYGRIYGVYVQLGDRIFMVFPGDHDGEVYLTGTVTDEGLFIDELEPDKGACQ